MADDNRPLKYMRYAIGEIVLVVVGILIALQINTWNENRKDNENLKSYLHVVLLNLEDDLLIINFTIERLKEVNKKTKSFLNHPDYNTFTLDSLEQSIETFYLDDATAS